METLNEDDVTSNAELLFIEILDSMIVDVASESHRIARLGLDRHLDQQEEEMRLSAEARALVADPSQSDDGNGKCAVDVYGQTHPAIGSEIFACMNCGRSVMAGRFAPHLEACMGKGRKGRAKSTRSTTAARGRGHSSQIPHPDSTGKNHLSNGSSGIAGDEHSNGNSKKPRCNKIV